MNSLVHRSFVFSAAVLVSCCMAFGLYCSAVPGVGAVALAFADEPGGTGEGDGGSNAGDTGDTGDNTGNNTGDNTGDNTGGESGGDDNGGTGSGEDPNDGPSDEPVAKEKQTVSGPAFSATAAFDSLEVKAAPTSDKGVKPQYSLDKKSWQASPKFSSLKPGTTYTIYVQWPGSDKVEALEPRVYGSATTDYVKIVKLASKKYNTKKNNIAKGRTHYYIAISVKRAAGVTVQYRYKVGGSWKAFKNFAGQATTAPVKELGKLKGKKRTIEVQVRALDKSGKVVNSFTTKQAFKIGTYKLENIGDKIVTRALKYTSRNYYYLMSDYGRNRKYSSKRRTGIDCSGLVSCTLRDLGIKKYTKSGLQVSTQIAKNSKKVSKKAKGAKALEKAKAGDAIYWGDWKHWIGGGHNAFRHIAFYAGKINGKHYIVDSYPWRSGIAGYSYCKKLCLNPTYKGKKNSFHHGVNLRPLTKREIRQITSVHRFY